jgi:tetratricopeptide (TPR) repeat protein
MAVNLKNPVHFWQELKQRRVVRVVTVYLASAFAILEGVDMVFTRVGLPSWTVTLVMILLGCGLIIAIIFSWIYDITPEGIVKTPDMDQVRSEEKLAEGVVIAPGKPAASGKDEDLIVQENKLYAEKINKYKKKERIYSLSSVGVMLAAIILFLFSTGSTIPFSKRDWILITDFENLTENPVFDKSLYTAFSLSINQSRYINVFPRSRMLEIMGMMKIEDMTYIDERTGQHIATREGIKNYIVPSISEVGDKYVLTSKIVETKSGDLLQSVILESDNQQSILAKLDRMSRKIRRTLGESRYHIATQDKPLAKVTTSSLEALKQYSLGIERNWLSDFTGAVNYYENALRIDSGFTAARASLGNLLIERFNPVRGEELLSQAVKQVDDLTDLEKYAILALHAVNVENDLPKGIEYTRKLTRLYPDNPTFHNNLGLYYEKSGLIDEALEEYKTAIRIDPNRVLTYGGLLWTYLAKLGNIDSALVWSGKMIADNPQNAWGYFYLGSAYIALDSINEAERAFQKAREINPYLLENQYRLAHTYRMQGKYKEAIRILERILEINQYQFPAYCDIGVNYKLLGDQVNAHKYFSWFKDTATGPWLKEYPDLAETYTTIAAVTAYMGDMESSNEMLHKALEIDTTLHQRYAGLYSIQGKIPEAIDQIEKALEKGYRNLTWLKMDPGLMVLQNEPRFRELLDKYFNQN